jgi:ATP-dependent DNA ligase
MALEVPPTLEPMEAKPVRQLPDWLLAPKYDVFRCLILPDDQQTDLCSRRSRPLGRYFPEIVEAAHSLLVTRFVLDGELIVPNLPFDALQLRLYPAASRSASSRKNIPPVSLLSISWQISRVGPCWHCRSESAVPRSGVGNTGDTRHLGLLRAGSS